MPGIFEKYASAIPKPNGRPVGVRDGEGQAPQRMMNPALQGMVNANSLMSRPATKKTFADFKPFIFGG